MYEYNHVHRDPMTGKLVIIFNVNKKVDNCNSNNEIFPNQSSQKLTAQNFNRNQFIT